MSTKLYPRFGCSFCTVNRDKKEQIMTHLDEHIPEVTKHMGHPTRPSGNHFIPLLRAVRRRSGRQGNNALIQLTESEYDQCLNWRLYEIIRSEGEFTKYIRRKQRSQAEWKAAAIAFLRSDEADDAAVDNRALWDSYSPDWSNTAKGEDDEDDDGEEAWEKYVVSAATWRDISGVNSYVGNRSGPPGKSYIDDGEMNARVSGFEYPVMSNNGKYTVHHESTGLMKHTGKVNWTESPPDKTTAKADGMAKLMEADSGSDQGPRLAARRSKANAQSKKKRLIDDKEADDLTKDVRKVSKRPATLRGGRGGTAAKGARSIPNPMDEVEMPHRGENGDEEGLEFRGKSSCMPRVSGVSISHQEELV